MQRAVLQVPVDSQLKQQAEKAAASQGFSSLQEAVRLFLAKLAEKRIELTFQETIKLSPKAEKRYLEMTEDFEKGKNVYTAKNVEDLMKQLNADSLPSKVR